LAAVLIQIVKTGLVLAHVDAIWFNLIVGVVLATAAGIDALRHRRRV
jgi:ABC-type xylose transport system permease subunit